MNDIIDTLKERKSRYGAYSDNAYLTQALLGTCMIHPGWGNLTPVQSETLHMIFHKVSRILNGDPNYHDSWHDIAGYATLQANLCEKDND